MICSQCPKKFEKGKICTFCSKLYCSEHHLVRCSFCDVELIPIENEIEKIGNVEVNWLSVDNKKRVGICGIDFLPEYFMKIESVVRSSNDKVRVILFSSKEKSIEFEKSFLKQNNIQYNERVTTEKSRYSFIAIPDSELNYILLNTCSLTEKTAIFLTLFNLTMFDNILSNVELFTKLDEEFISSIGAVFFSYNSKLGIPFVTVNEYIQQHIKNLVNNLHQNYCEIISIVDLLKCNEYNNEIADYIKYKIEIIFSVHDFDARFLLPEVFQNLQKILHLAILISGVSSNIALKKFLNNVFDRHYKIFKMKYSELPDLLRASDYVQKNKSKLDFSSYEKYVSTVCELIKISFSQIEARYVSLAEALDLYKISQFYLYYLEKRVIIHHPDIGTVNDYIDMLSKIMDRDEIYPEVRIFAGLSLENILMNWLHIEPNFLLFQIFADSMKKLAQLIEEKLPEIQLKNGSFDDFHGSSITYEDAAFKLDHVRSIAAFFNCNDVKKEFDILLNKVVDKHNLVPFKSFLLWELFLETQNFSYLPEIHRMLQKINFENYPHHKDTLVPINLLIETILYQDKRVYNIEDAKQIIMDHISEGADSQIQIAASVVKTETFLYLFEMFEHLLQFENDSKKLRSAYIASLALIDSLQKKVFYEIDPVNILAIKTQILFKLVKNNFVDVLYLCKKLDRYSDSEGYIKIFVKLVKRWININTIEERKFIHRPDFEYSGKDVWIKILCSIVNDLMDEDLNKNLAGNKALIFVEGVTDLIVFQKFLDMLYPKQSVFFMDIEGFTNYRYYAESRFIQELRIPAYLIFDGDTRQEDKKKAIDYLRLSMPSSRIYTLNQNSIENYILNPKAIAYAYSDKGCSEEEIHDFLNSKKNSKNKKQVLKILFKQFNLGSYNKIAAQKIAQEIDVNDIDDEIKQLLKKIVNLETVTSV